MSKRKRMPWTRVEYEEVISLHEAIIAAYPQEIGEELRRARRKFLATVRVV